jgi:SAM-dependent methyltransferase
MTIKCHLYPGFRHVGALASINAQRLVQGGLLRDVAPKSLLIVGSGYGEELDLLVACQPSIDNWSILSIIDLADVHGDLASQPHLAELKRKPSFRRLNLLDAAELQEFGAFDCVQCSFVLHDIFPHEKDRALRALAESVRRGGHVLVSDIFVQLPEDANEISEIYDGFIHEAEAAFREGGLREDEFHALVGDGNARGLKRSRREAVRGERDFFEPLDVLLERARRVALTLVDVIQNPLNARLFVLLFSRDDDDGHKSTQRAGDIHVV